MAKFTFMDSFLVGLKGIVAGIVTGIITFMLVWLTNWLIRMQDMLVVGVLVGLATIFLSIVLWGYFAHKFWRWR